MCKQSRVLTPRRRHQIVDLFAGEARVAREVTSSAYQNIIDARRSPDTNAGKVLKRAEINALISRCVPSSLTEPMPLGRMLTH